MEGNEDRVQKTEASDNKLNSSFMDKDEGECVKPKNLSNFLIQTIVSETVYPVENFVRDFCGFLGSRGVWIARK